MKPTLGYIRIEVNGCFFFGPQTIGTIPVPSEQAVASSVDQILEEACARNTPAELHYESRTKERSISRIRLLELTPTEILSDTPLVMGAQPPIPPNRPITVHMVLNGNRWQFSSTINKSGLDVRLNERETLKGISLQRPDRITPSQRRADYRISLASLDPILVQMARPHRSNPLACAWPGTSVESRAIDLSAGGMALILDRDLIREAKRDETFFLSFSLPETEDSFEMMGSVRHMRLLHDDTSLRLAIAFTEWGSGTLKADQTRIARFIANCQRNSIRRRK